MGNKNDLKNNRVVDLSRGKDKALKQKMNKFVEVSAKTKENLMETFKEFYMEIYRKNKKKLFIIIVYMCPIFEEKFYYIL